jgi:tetratricopeptide (TPR) repeat protein
MWRPNDDLTMNRALVTVAAGVGDAHLRLGESLRARSRMPEAAEAYREALKLDPEYAQAHVMLGVTLATLGQVDEAVQSYRQALEIQPGNATAHFNLAAILEGQGQIEEALSHYQQATQGGDAQAEQMAREGIQRLQSQRNRVPR